MNKRQFYTFKFSSSRLKKFNYSIELSFEDGQKYGEIIALFDSQMLRSIREIQKKMTNAQSLEALTKQLNGLKKNNITYENPDKIRRLKNKLKKFHFIQEYITIKIDHPSHYHYLIANGLVLNKKKYIRFSSSAGQARANTVVFVEEKTAMKLNKILNNGRDLKRPLVPSKFNAYKGLASSATRAVSTPRFCLITDYFSTTEMNVNFITETPLDEDDAIESKTINQTFNRFDGQGLISYEMSAKWAKELGLDYVPAQWCVRQNFLKGMLVTFPIHEFCEKINNGNYIITTAYKNKNGTYKKVNLKEIDVIISQSMFKLWDSWESIEAYQENCQKNKLQWGVSLYTPKQDKDILRMNYQFLQTLNLTDTDLVKLCKPFTDWLNGVTANNVFYTMLFLLGSTSSKEKLKRFLADNDNNWAKALMIYPDLINDSYVKKKIYQLVKRKIERGYLGEIIVDGNFQTLVSDPFAMMEHACGLQVHGLLAKKEYYSNYWNHRNIKQISSMRAPLTFRSENLLLKLKQTKKMDHWYRYNTTGIIVNVHGWETAAWAGSDFDMDIIATTSNPQVIKGIYCDELPVVYEPPTAKAWQFNEADLHKADLLSFGSMIGSITNKSTSAYALLAQFPHGSKEYEAIMRRIKMCTKLQSAQIDKAKIGREVKGIPSNWVQYQKTSEHDKEAEKQHKQFLNRIRLDRHPYFFIHLYNDTKRKYKQHLETYQISCLQRFGLSLDELKQLTIKSLEQNEFLKLYQEFLPVIDSDCVMNRLCKYIETVNFQIRDKMKTTKQFDYHQLYDEWKPEEFQKKTYNKIKALFSHYLKLMSKLTQAMVNRTLEKNDDFNNEIRMTLLAQYDQLRLAINKLCSNEQEALKYVIHLFYVDLPKANKDILWEMYGELIFTNLMKKTMGYFLFPYEDKKGEIIYLGKRYTLKRWSFEQL